MVEEFSELCDSALNPDILSCGIFCCKCFSFFPLQYDPTFGNAFWNSSTEGFAFYLFLLLTNWALVCDVWYLPKMTRQVINENRAVFT